MIYKVSQGLSAEDGTWTHTSALLTRSLVLLVCQFRHFRIYLLPVIPGDLYSIASDMKDVNKKIVKNFRKKIKKGVDEFIKVMYDI